MPRSPGHSDAKRKKWRCPRCRRRYRVLADFEPELCPECIGRQEPPPATPDERKIRFERADPLVELLSQLTGHRFAQQTLVRSAIGVAVIIAAVVPILVLRRSDKSVNAKQDAAPAVGAEGGFRAPVVAPAVHRDRLAASQDVVPIRPVSQPAIDVRSYNFHEVPTGPRQDPDLITIRAWLKEHLDDRDWDEVKWWPAKSVDDDLVTYAGLVKSDRVARLKYRLKAPSETEVLHDDLFVFRDKEVRPVPDGENRWWDEWGGWTGLIMQGGRRLLPDDGEQIAKLGGAIKPLPSLANNKATRIPARRTLSDKAKKDAERLGKSSLPRRGRRALANQSNKAKPAGQWWANLSDEADVDRVREWLKDNVSDWEEIKWWKPRDFLEYHSSTNAQHSVLVPVQFRGSGLRFAAPAPRPDRVTKEHVCRIRIRVKDHEKGPKIVDRLFLIDNETVEPILDPNHKRHEWKYFPDSAGVKPEAAKL